MLLDIHRAKVYSSRISKTARSLEELAEDIAEIQVRTQGWEIFYYDPTS